MFACGAGQDFGRGTPDPLLQTLLMHQQARKLTLNSRDSVAEGTDQSLTYTDKKTRSLTLAKLFKRPDRPCLMQNTRASSHVEVCATLVSEADALQPVVKSQKLQLAC